MFTPADIITARDRVRAAGIPASDGYYMVVIDAQARDELAAQLDRVARFTEYKHPHLPEALAATARHLGFEIFGVIDDCLVVVADYAGERQRN